MPNQEYTEPTSKKVVIVAPIWLQNTLSLWLQVVGKIEVVTCTTKFEALPFDMGPDLVVFSAAQEQAEAQIQKIKGIWPTARLLVVYEDSKHTSLPLEAPKGRAPDVTWLLEPSPKQLLNAINEWLGEPNPNCYIGNP